MNDPLNDPLSGRATFLWCMGIVGTVAIGMVVLTVTARICLAIWSIP